MIKNLIRLCLSALVLSFFTTASVGYGQIPAWAWARSAIGPSIDYANSVIADNTGSIYVTGYFYNSITFGFTTLTGAGIADVFIAKYDANGNIIWAKSAGGNGYDYSQSIVTDGSGSLYITGNFSGDSIVLGNVVLHNSSPGTSDVYVARYDTAGNVIWALKGGGSGDDYGRSIACHSGGRLAFTGWFNSAAATFGSTVLTNAASGSGDVFVCRCDTAGNINWAKKYGGNGIDEGRGIACDAAGNIYLTGSFQSATILFGSALLTRVGVAGYDVYTAKFDTLGNVLWAKSGGGTGHDEGYCIAVSSSGTVYISGCFQSTSIAFGSATLNNTGGFNYPRDLFLVKYNSSGVLQWANGYGGNDGDFGSGLALDIFGYVYLTGYYFSPVISFGSTTLNNAGGFDLYVAKFSSAGNAVWAAGAGGTLGDNGIGITTDNNSHVFVAGRFDSPQLVFGHDTVPYSGAGDIFVAKIFECFLAQPVITQAGDTLFSSPAFSYQWFLNSNVITGADSQMLIPSQSGNYQVEIADSLGCTAVSAPFYFSVTEIQPAIPGAERSQLVFPNPAQKEFTVSLPPAAENVTISSMRGEIIVSMNPEGKKYAVFSIERPGLYFIQIRCGAGQIVEKIMITN